MTRLWSNVPFWLLALFISLCIARGVATYNDCRAVLAAMLLTEPYGFHFIFITPTQEKKIHRTVSLCGCATTTVFAWEKVRKKDRKTIGALDLNSILSILGRAIVLETAQFLGGIKLPKVSGVRCCHTSRYCWSILIDLCNFREYQCPYLPHTLFCLCN